MNPSADSDWTSHELYWIASKAYSLYLQGRYREAGMIFKGLTAIDPRARYFRLALATIYVAQEDLHGALEELNQLISVYPNDLEARARRCEVCLRLERQSEAQNDLNFLRRHEGSQVRRLQLLIPPSPYRSEKPGEAI